MLVVINIVIIIVIIIIWIVSIIVVSISTCSVNTSGGTVGVTIRVKVYDFKELKNSQDDYYNSY